MIEKEAGTNPTGSEREPSAYGGPLVGLRVLDVGMLAAGPWAATFLADLGADVIKVEHPRLGDPSRTYGTTADGVNLFWKNLGRNKRCITIDLSRPRGQALLIRLAARTDVLIENFRAGTLDRWNLDWETLKQANPDLVMVRTSGFGQDGPYSGYPGFGTLAESMAGFANATGHADGPPLLPQFPLADGLAAMMGAFSALAGVYHVKVNQGAGQWIDNTLYEPIMRLLEQHVIEYAATSNIRSRNGNRLADVSPRGAYESKEPGRWIAISGSNQPTARRIFEAIGRADLNEDPRLADNSGRVAHADLIDAALTDWISKRTVDEALTAFRAADAPAALVYTAADVLNDPHFRMRNTHVRVSDSELGEVTMQAPMPRFSETPGEIRHVGASLGAHNDEIFGDLLGLGREELSDLRAEGVI